MIPSVEEVLQLSARLLGDPLARKFTPDKLQPFFEMAYEELVGEMARYHVAKQKRAVLYTLPANTTTLTPETAGISNFGEMIRMEERRSGSSDLFTLVEVVDRLPQVDPTDKLLYQEWYDDTWHFLRASNNIELRINYWDSGVAPTTGSVGLDGAKNFLAYRTAAAAALPYGNVELGRDLDRQARGPQLDGGAGFMHTFIQAQVTAAQQMQLQPPAYRAFRVNPIGRPPGFRS